MTREPRLDDATHRDNPNARIAELEKALLVVDERLREHGDTTRHPVRAKIARLIGTVAAA